MSHSKSEVLQSSNMINMMQDLNSEIMKHTLSQNIITAKIKWNNDGLVQSTLKVPATNLIIMRTS